MSDDPRRNEDPDVTRTHHGGGSPPPVSLPGMPASIGRYRVVGKLGEGGMGVVYEAEQDSPRRRVAVKVVRAGHAVDEQHVRMFLREIETLARLDEALELLDAVHEDAVRAQVTRYPIARESAKLAAEYAEKLGDGTAAKAWRAKQGG